MLNSKLKESNPTIFYGSPINCFLKKLAIKHTELGCKKH